MRITKELRLLVQESEESKLSDRLDDLYNWLYESKKPVLAEAIELIEVQKALIENLTRELADLRKEQADPNADKLLFQLSTPVRRKWS